MKLKLSSKIFLIGTLPLFLFLFLGGVIISNSLSSLKNDKDVLDAVNMLVINSEYISKLLSEREATVAAVKSGESVSGLASVRDLTDKQSEKLSKAIAELELFDVAGKRNSRNKLNQITSIRSSVNARAEASEILAMYNTHISDQISLFTKVADLSHIDGITEEIRSLALLLTSEDEIGQTKILLSSFFRSQEELSNKDIQKVMKLNAGATENLNSRALVITEEGRSKLNSFLASSHWQQSQGIINSIVTSGSVENLKIEQQSIWAIYSQIIGDLSSLVDEEAGRINGIVEGLSSNAIFDVISLSIILGLAAIALILTTLFISKSINLSINKIVENLDGCATEVASASDEIKSASESLSDGANRSASSLEEIVSSVEEISSMVKQNAENSREANSLSQSSRNSAEVGQREINRLIESINQIAESSEKMEDIIKVIDDIAFQTNLLALNAAVEAARAGEQGKGFAVVAEAVRNLAQRSAQSAKDISGLIKDTISKTERGAEVAGESGKALSTIVESATKVADLVAEISTASEEQSRGITQVGQALNELDRVSQGTAASAEESAASSVEMSAQSQSLLEAVESLNFLIQGNTKAYSQEKNNFTNKTAHSNVLTLASNKNNFSRPVAVPPKSAEEIIPFDSDDDRDLKNLSGF